MRTDASPTRVRYGVVAALCAASAIAYIQRNLLGVAESTLRNEWGFSKEQMGLVLSVWLWTYAAFQIPSGRLGDRVGSRWCLPAFCILWSAATWGTGLASALWLLVALRLLFGAAQAGIFPCGAIIVREWLPETSRGRATAAIAAFQQVGGIAGTLLAGWWLGMHFGLWDAKTPDGAAAAGAPAWIASVPESLRPALRSIFHWRGMFFWLALPGVVWGAWFAWWFRDRPADHPGVNAAERTLMPPPVANPDPGNAFSQRPPSSEGKTEGDRPDAGRSVDASVWAAMAASPTMWLICGQQFCRGFGYIFYQTWFATFLQESRGVTIQKSGVFTSLTLGAALAGSLVGGSVSDWVLIRTRSRRLAKQGVAIVGLTGAALLATAAYFTTTVEAAIAVLCLGSFCAALAGPSAYALTIDVAGRHVATVFGTMNMAGNIGAAVFPLIVPPLLRIPACWTGPVSGWNLVLLLFAGVYAVAALCWAFLDPNRTVFESPAERIAPGARNG